MKKHQKIVKEIVEKYKKDKSVIAITLFGSMAQGKERPDSDIDIEIISTKAKKWRLLNKKKNRIKIDLVITPKKELIYQIKKYPFLCYDYLFEKIIYDKIGFMEKTKDKLKKYFKKHPEVEKFWREKNKTMRKAKNKGQKPENPFKVWDGAEILFSKEHKITRNFFKEK